MASRLSRIQYLSDLQAEKLFGLRRGSLAELRNLERGPRHYLCHGFAIRYDKCDVQLWLEWAKKK